MRFEHEHPFRCVEGVATGKTFLFRRPSSCSVPPIDGMEGEKEKAVMFRKKELCFRILLEEKQICDLMTLHILSLLG